MRGMIKWKPFNTLLNNRDINDILKKRNMITKPIIMEDRIIEIDNLLKIAINENKIIKIKYFDKGKLKYISGNIRNINLIEKYILISSTRIYFKNLIKVEIINQIY